MLKNFIIMKIHVKKNKNKSPCIIHFLEMRNMTEQDLTIYNTLLARRSIRSYKPTLINGDVLDQIRNLPSMAFPSGSANKFQNEIFVYHSHSTEGKSLSSLGRIMNPPYFMTPYISGNSLPLVDLGFRTQLIVFTLWQMGIGSCYIGCVHRQERVKKALGFPENAKIASFLVFGYADDGQHSNIYQKIVSIFTGNKERLPLDALFIGSTLPDFLELNYPIMKIIEAGRFAPSATNTQPWRFAVSQDQFIIFAHNKKVANIYDLEQGYSMHDTGICMANMSLAANALGLSINWKLTTNEIKRSFEAKSNTPIAWFSLADIGVKK